MKYVIHRGMYENVYKCDCSVPSGNILHRDMGDVEHHLSLGVKGKRVTIM